MTTAASILNNWNLFFPADRSAVDRSHSRAVVASRRCAQTMHTGRTSRRRIMAFAEYARGRRDSGKSTEDAHTPQSNRKPISCVRRRKARESSGSAPHSIAAGRRGVGNADKNDTGKLCAS